MDYRKYKKQLNEMVSLDEIADATSAEKGDALPNAVKLLFDGLEYMELRGEKKRTQTCEFDLICRNNYKDRDTVLNDFGRHIVVECKNWKVSIGASHVRDFAMKLQKAKVQFGLLFTKAGITGKGARDAAGEIKFLFDKYNIYVVVFDLKELKSMANPKIGFYQLLETKLFDLQFST